MVEMQQDLWLIGAKAACFAMFKQSITQATTMLFALFAPVPRTRSCYCSNYASITTGINSDSSFIKLEDLALDATDGTALRNL